MKCCGRTCAVSSTRLLVERVEGDLGAVDVEADGDGHGCSLSWVQEQRSSGSGQTAPRTCHSVTPSLRIAQAHADRTGRQVDPGTEDSD